MLVNIDHITTTPPEYLTEYTNKYTPQTMHSTALVVYFMNKEYQIS